MVLFRLFALVKIVRFFCMAIGLFVCLTGCYKPTQIHITSPCNVLTNEKITQQTTDIDFTNLDAFIISTQNLQNALKNGKNLKKAQNLAFTDFISTLSKADIILLGEKHDEAKHHNAQLLIIAALEQHFLAQRPHCDTSIALVLEMLGANAQNHIDKALQKRQDITKENLKTALGWEKWDYKQYKDILEYVFYSPSFEIIAGNLSREEISIIYKEAQELKGNVSSTQEVKNQISKIISKSHKTNDEALLTKLTKVQQYKDRRMADKLFNSAHFAILLAGNYHITKTFGIPLHIEDFAASKMESNSSTSNDKELDKKQVISTKKVISIGMLKAKQLTSKKHRDKLLSYYDYVLVFR